jgi:hypothetical protein
LGAQEIFGSNPQYSSTTGIKLTKLDPFYLDKIHPNYIWHPKSTQMTLLSIQDVQVFYLTMMVASMVIAAVMSVVLIKQGKSLDAERKNILTFILLIIISYALPPLGRLLSFLFPASFDNLELMSSLYKIISLFNNLFILLTVRSLPGIKQRFSQLGVLPLVVGFVVVNMLLLLTDKFVLQGIPVGKAIIVVIDTLISVACLLLFTDAFNQLICRTTLQLSSWVKLFRVNISILIGLLAFSAALYFAKSFFAYAGPTIGTLTLIYALYLITSMLFVLYLLAVGQLIVSNTLNLPTATLGSSSDSDTKQDGVDLDVKDVKLNVKIERKNTNDARYILELQTQTGELIHSWQSDNCIYPYFYWIYLYTGTALSIAVDIKNAQVMRNKMIQVLGKTFKPNAWITLRGDQASLAIQLKQLVIDRTIFEHPSIKNKFRQHIDPFLSLIEYDSSRYEKDRMYNEYVFLTVYDEILRRLNHD